MIGQQQKADIGIGDTVARLAVERQPVDPHRAGVDDREIEGIGRETLQGGARVLSRFVLVAAELEMQAEAMADGMRVFDDEDASRRALHHESITP